MSPIETHAVQLIERSRFFHRTANRLSICKRILLCRGLQTGSSKFIGHTGKQSKRTAQKFAAVISSNSGAGEFYYSVYKKEE